MIGRPEAELRQGIDGTLFPHMPAKICRRSSKRMRCRWDTASILNGSSIRFLLHVETCPFAYFLYARKNKSAGPPLGRATRLRRSVLSPESSVIILNPKLRL